jgi:hypothetical protein
MRAAVGPHGARRRIGRRAVRAMQVGRDGSKVNALSERPVAKVLAVRPAGPKADVLSVRHGSLRANVLNARRAAKALLARPAGRRANVLNARRAALKASAENATVVSGQRALRAMKTRAARPLALLVARAEPTTRAVPALHAPVVASIPARVANALGATTATSRVGPAHPSAPALAPTAQAPSRAARSTAHRVTKARAGVRRAGATAGATNVRLQTNAASARSQHPSSVPTAIVPSAMTAAREHPPHAGSAIGRPAQSARSAPIAAFGAIAPPAHARRAATTTPLPAAVSATASVRHAPTRHRAAWHRKRGPRVRKNQHRAPPHIVGTTTTPPAPCAFPS